MGIKGTATRGTATRRTLLGTLAALALPPLGRPALSTPHPRLYLSARRGTDGGFHASAFTPAGERVLDVPLPGRGHSFAVSPDGAVAVHFARRPGTFARVLDLSEGRVTTEFAAPERRHFYGHGVFAPDGRLLYATENDYEARRGVIGVYDAEAGYRRLGELSSHGIGPHDIRLLSDGVTLAVANGGIATHPDFPRIKLNLPSMAPSLVYFDRRDGRLLEDARLPEQQHQLSIRHLAIGEEDLVALAMQDEGPLGRVGPLVALHRRGASPRLLDMPVTELRGMKQYCGSAAFDTAGRILAVSAPRGHRLAFWDARDERFLATVPLPDGCGIAPGQAAGEFLASSGEGRVIAIDAVGGSSRPFFSGFIAEISWDNHLVAAAV